MSKGKTKGITDTQRVIEEDIQNMEEDFTMEKLTLQG